jgi:hypothetical protein
LTQATNANRPTFNTSLLGGKSGMVFNGSTNCLASGSSIPAGQAAPLTFSTVFNPTAGGAGNDLVSENNSGNEVYTHESGAANQADAFFGAVLSATASDGSTHAMQTLINGASSAMYIDGTNTTGNAGAGGYNSSGVLGLGCFSPNIHLFVGNIFEAGIWAADKSANNSSVNSNQHSYWGF